MKKKFLFVSLLISSGISVFASGKIKSFLSDKSIMDANVGISVVNLSTGKSLFEHEPEKKLVPASVLKTISTATALELLGQDYTMNTTLAYSGTIDKKGVLYGNIYLIGGGDPSLGSRFVKTNQNEFVKNCIDAIGKVGITSVDGDVIADAGCLSREGVSHKWLWEDLGNYYAAGAYGLNYFDNTFALKLRTFAAGSRPEIIGTEPSIPNLCFYNYLTAKKNGIDSAYFYGAPYENTRYLYGTVPDNKDLFIINGDIPDPALFLAEVLKNELTSLKIRVSGKATTVRMNELAGIDSSLNRKVIYTWQSEPLSQLVYITNQRSNNLYAESMFKLISLKDSTGSTTNKSINLIKSFWSSKGLNPNELIQYDGSGLAPVDRVSAGFITSMLRYMYNDSACSDAFINSLPLAGIEGTVKNFLKDTPLTGKIRLKSGSIQTVQSYAGYYFGEENYAVCIMVNDFTTSRLAVNAAIQKLLLELEHY